ncbi:MAG TPA: carbon-nitrogen hydrolase family protein [Bryobacteraceae bacterium]|nr:carbon-nitrogen hydrolase family protein [Bryobacteraceae bacterium]
MRFPGLIFFATALLAAPLSVTQSGFVAGENGLPPGWRSWSPRAEIAPRVFVDNVHYRSRTGSLAISGNGIAGEHGGWEFVAPGVEPGAWYRFIAYYRCTGVPYESLQILPRVDWLTAAKKRAGVPDYVYQTSREGEWNRVTADVQAPPGGSSAVLQLYLSNAPQGTVWWDDISFTPIAPPEPRRVSIASINLRPSRTKSPAESVRQFVAAVERLVPGKTDVILLPEGITVIGTGKEYVEVAETIPGPTTRTLAELARQRSSYVAAGIYEREGSTVYNTAVLLDRRGEIAGKYRKVYLPASEVEGGLTPGNDYPVFRTDFGTVGLMICYDVFFSDPARALARQGAEVLLLPIWGGDETLAKARAIDNKVFLVTSGYDHPTYIMDPDGERLAAAPANGTAAIFTVDLNKRYWSRGLGDMRARRMKEQRVDVKVP